MGSVADESSIVPLSEFKGISVDKTRYASLDTAYREAAQLAVMLTDAKRLDTSFDANQIFSLAALGAMRNLHAIVEAAGGECDLSPPPASIQEVTDEDGRVILRCGHTRKVHEWDLDGNPL